MSDSVVETALDRLVAGDDPVLETLRAQRAVAQVARRERTAVGFFEIFRVPETAPRVAGRPDFVMDDVAGELVGLGGAARFLLSVREGALDFLEGAILGADWPDSARLVRVYYLRRGGPGGDVVIECAVRDLRDLRGRWST